MKGGRKRHFAALLALVLGASYILGPAPIAGSQSHEAAEGLKNPKGPKTAEEEVVPWKKLSEIVLPEKLRWARDVRALGEADFLFTVTDSGVMRWRRGSEPPFMTLARRGNGAREMWLVDALGASEELFAVAAPVFSLGWGRMDSEAGALADLYAIEQVSDLDLRGDRVLVLGARRDDQGSYAPRGELAWVGPLRKGPAAWKPVLYSTDGAAAASMSTCGMMKIGVARFLADGSYLIVPGVEEGVFHFAAEDRLLRTWTGEAVGFDPGCGLDEQSVDALSRHEPGRWAWVNRRRTIDEILPLPGGPGLVVRALEEERVTWRLATLEDGLWISRDLPLSSPSNLAHVSADVVGQRVEMLIWTWGTRPRGPAEAPRLVTMEIQ